MECSVTLSANAGVSLLLDGQRIWIDALHDHMIPGFSTLTPHHLALLEQHEAFRAPDLILYTHCHPDHFSLPLLQKAHERWPGARILLPEHWIDGQELVTGDTYDAVCGGVELRFLRLEHERPERYRISHYGLLLRCQGRTILTTGDGIVADPALLTRLGSERVDAALLNFPWASLPRGREFLRRQLQLQHLVVYHLPFAADDAFGYRKALDRTLAKDPPCGDVQVLDDFLQTVRLSL